MGQIKNVEPAIDVAQSYGDVTVEFTDRWYLVERANIYYYVVVRGVFHQYRTVRETRDGVFILVPKRMYDEFTEICDEYGMAKTPINRPPEYDEASCGVLTTRLLGHISKCAECRAASGKPPIRAKGVQAGLRKRDGDVKTVFALPELTEFTLDGLLDLMGKYRDEAVEIAASLEASVTAVSEVQTLFKRLAEIRQASPHLSAAMDHFLEVK
jgi:hypothetical protein